MYMSGNPDIQAILSYFRQGVVKDIVHESARGAPLAKVTFQNPYRFQTDNETMIAVEGLYTGQFIYAGKKGKAISMLQSQTFKPLMGGSR